MKILRKHTKNMLRHIIILRYFVPLAIVLTSCLSDFELPEGYGESKLTLHGILTDDTLSIFFAGVTTPKYTVYTDHSAALDACRIEYNINNGNWVEMRQTIYNKSLKGFTCKSRYRPHTGDTVQLRLHAAGFEDATIKRVMPAQAVCEITSFTYKEESPHPLTLRFAPYKGRDDDIIAVTMYPYGKATYQIKDRETDEVRDTTISLTTCRFLTDNHVFAKYADRTVNFMSDVVSDIVYSAYTGSYIDHKARLYFPADALADGLDIDFTATFAGSGEYNARLDSFVVETFAYPADWWSAYINFYDYMEFENKISYGQNDEDYPTQLITAALGSQIELGVQERVPLYNNVEGGYGYVGCYSSYKTVFHNE